MKRMFANAVFYLLIGFCVLLAWAVMWAAENMDLDPEQRIRQHTE